MYWSDAAEHVLKPSSTSYRNVRFARTACFLSSSFCCFLLSPDRAWCTMGTRDDDKDTTASDPDVLVFHDDVHFINILCGWCMFRSSESAVFCIIIQLEEENHQTAYHSYTPDPPTISLGVLLQLTSRIAFRLLQHRHHPHTSHHQPVCLFSWLQLFWLHVTHVELFRHSGDLQNNEEDLRSVPSCLIMSKIRRMSRWASYFKWIMASNSWEASSYETDGWSKKKTDQRKATSESKGPERPDDMLIKCLEVEEVLSLLRILFSKISFEDTIPFVSFIFHILSPPFSLSLLYFVQNLSRVMWHTFFSPNDWL